MCWFLLQHGKLIVLWGRMFRLIELAPHHPFFAGKKFHRVLAQKMLDDTVIISHRGRTEGGTDDGGLVGMDGLVLQLKSHQKQYCIITYYYEGQ